METGRAFRLHRDHFPYDVSRVHVNRANRHDLSSIAFDQISAEYRYQCIQLINLLSLIIFERVFETFLQPRESHIHLCRPPNLTTA